MVQGVGINKQNYSVEQLKELKNAGVQGISDNDIKAAEKREAANAKASDEKNISYKITDDASEVNEAQKEVEDAKTNGKKLKEIVENLTNESIEKNKNIQTIKKELEQYEVQLQDYIDANIELEEDSEAQLKNCEEQTKADAQKAEQIQKDIETKSKTINDVYNNSEASEADIANAENEQKDIEDLTSEYAQIRDTMDKRSNYSNKEIQKIAKGKAESLGKSMQDVTSMLQTDLNNAINANEYADITIEKGFEATKLKDNRDEACKAGFDNGHWFGRFFATKLAESMGNAAIAHGENLGNSSQSVIKDVNTVRKEYGISMKASKGVNNILKKEYVNTDSMGNIKELEKGNDIITLIKNGKAAQENRAIINDVADQAKKKNGQTT